MDATDSFIELIDQLRQGDPQAAEDVYREYARRLIGLAHRHLTAHIRAKVEPEDVVQSVFGTFFRRCRVTDWEIASRNSLWALLAEITYHKCCRTQRKYLGSNRDVRRETSPPAAESSDGWNIAAHQPSPGEAAELTELVGRLMSELPESEQDIVRLRLQGMEIEEISQQTGYSARTVFRRLDRVRQRLQVELAADRA